MNLCVNQPLIRNLLKRFANVDSDAKDKIPMVNWNLAVAFANKGISAFHFNFAGNGDSGGSFQYRNNCREVDDLRSVIQCLEQEKRFVTAIIGYNKGVAYQLIPQNPQAQSRTYEISTPSSGSKDLVLLTYNIMPFDLPSLSLLLLYLVLFSLERSKTRRSAKQVRNFSLSRCLPWGTESVTGITKIRWVSGSGNLGESDGLDSSIFTKAWVDSAGSEGLKDHSAIDGSLKRLLILTSLIGHGADKAMAVFEFLDFKRKNKIRAFVDSLIERHMAIKTYTKFGEISIDVKYQEAILGCQEKGHHLEVLILLAYSYTRSAKIRDIDV
nr:alpha/beta hydrolases superfamily protein [Tanacetum cinerariifolium]